MISSQQDQPSTSSAAMNLQSLQQSLPQIQKSNFLFYSTKFPLNSFEIVNLMKISSQYESIKILEIENCPTTVDASRLISNFSFRSLLDSLKNFTTLILKINEVLDEKYAEKPKSYEFNIERNFLKSYESNEAANEKIIYWKNGKDRNYLKINLMKKYSAELTDFVRNFLIDNVNMNYDKSIFKNFDLISINDSNNSNLLMKAVESGQSPKLIDELLNLPFDINQKTNDGKTAADIAYEKENNRILIQLLEVNSTFPKDFCADELETNESSESIKKILQIAQDMHVAIKENNLTIMRELIKQKPNLRYFYNSLNVSATTTALNSKKIEAYKILLENECSIGPNENISDVIDKYAEAKRNKIKSALTNVHDDASKPLPEKHLLILCANSLICHDDQHDKHRLKIIREAYNYLNENQITKQILQLSSMHKNFKIYFDFNRSSIEFMNPAGGDQSTRGLYEHDGIKNVSLYIGAKELLLNDVDDKFAALGTLAHELCHFAMNLTFCNDAKPYAVDDEENKAKFNEIIRKYKVIPLEILKRMKQVKKFVNQILFCQNLLQKSSDELNKMRKKFQIRICASKQLIYKSYEKIAINEEQIAGINVDRFKLKNSIEFNEFNENFDGDIKNKLLKRIKFNERTMPTKINEMDKLREQIIDSEKQLEECNEELQLCKSNHQASITEYENEISQLEEEIRDVKERSDYEEIVSLVFNNYDEDLWPAELIVRVPHMICHYQNDSKRLNELRVTFKDLFDYYDDVVVPKMSQTLKMLKIIFNNSNEIKFSDLTDAYKAKIHHSNVDFQGVEVKFSKIIEEKNSEIFQQLSSENIRGVLIENKCLKIGCAQEMKTKFYIERDFIDFGIRAESRHWTKDILNYLINFDQISSIAVATKMILLSDCAGAGKTTTFKHLSVKLKDKFPHYWISYIDLKRHLRLYEKIERNIQVSKVLKEILSITDELEIKIFTKLFESDRVILLYDSVDEIAPKYKDIFIKFIRSIRNSTKIQQWIATRPQHMQELKNKFNKKAYKLLPYDEDEKIKLSKNVLKDLEIENIKADTILKNINQTRPYRNKIDNPLMIQMMTELYANDDTFLKYYNLFSLYDKMIEMKKRILGDKGEIANIDRDNQKAKLTIWQVHQIYALKLLYKDGFEDCLNETKTIDINEFQLLKRWNKIEKSKWTPEAISRYGFLYVDNWNTDDEFPDFVHRTFAEFFAAQFVIQDLYELDENDDNEMSEREIEMRVNLLIGIVDIVYFRNFISSFIDIHEPKKMHKHFFKLITSKEVEKLLTIKDGSFNYRMIKIFSIDERFLKEFRFNGNLTFFQYAINECDLFDTQRIVDTYKSCLGPDWIHHSGYSLKENFSMTKYKETIKIYNLIDQLEIPQNDLLKFLSNNEHKSISVMRRVATNFIR